MWVVSLARKVKYFRPYDFTCPTALRCADATNELEIISKCYEPAQKRGKVP